ncbi:MAG: protein TolR [Gammaproteobacteria bacterium]|nr:MAG: protein TolR [Gammaproteobacteria bacterium]RKZ43714.1 MAG: protein TolR [Gammaproteobacteria bacterium]RKZ73583.1 MAG: protein TolR [Gammaproteobacteria bacterium]
MSRYRRRRRRISEMNVVPYIDVMLVLLIIFMITSPLLSRSVEVELPTVRQAENVTPTQTKFVIVTINAQGQLFLDEDKQTLTMTELIIRLTALIRFEPNSQVFIRGDSRLAYGEIIKVMSLLQEVGVYKVGLLTKPL